MKKITLSIVFASFMCVAAFSQTMSKVIIDSADQFLDKPRNYFISSISEYKPKQIKMTRPKPGYVDIIFVLKDKSKIEVRFVDTPPNQTVYMIQETY